MSCHFVLLEEGWTSWRSTWLVHPDISKIRGVVLGKKNKPTGMCRQQVAKSVSQFFIFFSLLKSEPKLKIWNMVNFGQNFAQNWTNWYMNGSLFLGKLVYVRVKFQIPSSKSYRNQTWVTPPPRYLWATIHQMLLAVEVSWWWHHLTTSGG